MAKPLRVRAEAAREAEEAASWYGERSESARAGFEAAIALAFRMIAKNPKLYATHVAKTRRYVLRKYSYVVVYVERAHDIMIVAVSHQKQRTGYWRDRLRE